MSRANSKTVAPDASTSMSICVRKVGLVEVLQCLLGEGHERQRSSLRDWNPGRLIRRFVGLVTEIAARDVGPINDLDAVKRTPAMLQEWPARPRMDEREAVDGAGVTSLLSELAQRCVRRILAEVEPTTGQRPLPNGDVARCDAYEQNLLSIVDDKRVGGDARHRLEAQVLLHGRSNRAMKRGSIAPDAGALSVRTAVSCARRSARDSRRRSA